MIISCWARRAPGALLMALGLIGSLTWAPNAFCVEEEIDEEELVPWEMVDLQEAERKALVNAHTLSSWDEPRHAWHLERAPEIVQIDGVLQAPTDPAYISVFPEGPSWQPGDPSSTFSDAGGILDFTTVNEDALTTPYGFSVYGPAVDTIELQMRVSHADRLWFSWLPGSATWDWSDEDGNCRLPLPVRTPGKLDVWEIKTHNLKEWRGRTMEGLRIVAPAGAHVEIHSIKLRHGMELFQEAPWGVKQVRLGSELRPCIYTWSPMRLAFPIPHSAIAQEHLRFTVDTARLALLVNKEAYISLSLDTPEESRVFFEARLRTRGGWKNIDTAVPAPRPGEQLVIRTHSSSGRAALVLWGKPTLYRSRADSALDPVSSPNILLYVVDSLRADHTSPYGYERDTSPFLNELAARGVTFSRFLTQDTCTKASITTLMTSVDTMLHAISCTGPAEPAGFTLFPTLLRERGYVTGAISENLYAPPFLENQLTYDELADVNEHTAAFDGTTRNRANQFFAANANRPFFLYVHTMEAHIRTNENGYHYQPSEAFLGRWNQPEAYPAIDLHDLSTWREPSSEFLIDRYDETIAFADDNFRQIVESLRAHGLAENTIIIFTSDHGQGFGAHKERIVHGYEPYEELIRVPLIISWPGQFDDGRTLDMPASILDLAPTLLELTGSEPLADTYGRSLRSYLYGENPGEQRPLLAYQEAMFGILASSSLSEGSWKVLSPIKKPWSVALFDIAGDPGEKQDLRDEYPEIFRRMVAQLHAHMRKQIEKRLERGGSLSPTKRSETFDPERAERLSTLGYIE
jgi:arylsulfatase A-like enzyme